MSKQQAAGRAPVRSRMSGLVGYLRDRPIWVKLGLIMMVPTIATVFVGFSALLTNINSANNADRARTLASLAADAGALVHNLQDERAAATRLLTTTDANTQKNLLTQYQGLFGTTTSAARTYTGHRNALANLPANFRDQLKTIDIQLGTLSSLHQQVQNVTDIPLNTVIQRYQALIKSLIDLRDAASQLAGDTTLSYDMRAGSAIANVKEQLSQERVTVLEILAQHELTPVAYQDFITSLAGQTLALTPFYNVATQAQRDLLSQIVTGPNLREAQQYESQLTQLTPGPLPVNMFTADDWDSAMIGRADLMRAVEKKIDDQTVADAGNLRDRVQRQVLIEAALLLGLVLIAVLIAWFVARSMNRSLRELRHGALAIAQYGLPQAVARLRDPALATQAAPAQVAQQIAEPLPVRSKDEFGQVTEAFNAVHLEAVRTAAEQAALRSSVATMFVNLARRSQILVDRLIGHLDRLERGEEDPDRLAELFQLDHLATRMRRNDENLLVLAGADSTRVQREPAALIDVLRAAQSEVEHYTRIEFGVIDRDIEVGSHAVNDLVHLVAELFDNATAFSPPDSTVIVEARRVGDRAVLYVEDHGIGISPEQLAELNERLATPPMVDVAVSRMMGLVVVARLAARHGVKVELRPSAERGTIADVLLPTTVLVPRALSGRGTGGTPPITRESPIVSAPPAQQPPAQRQPFGAPLALESGPLGDGGRRSPVGAGAGPAMPTGPSTGGFGSGPVGFAGGPPRETPHIPVNGSVSGPPVGGGRHLPAWSDLTGAVNGTGAPTNGTPAPPQTNGTDVFSPRRPSGPGDPLPQRRATEPRTVDGEVSDDERPFIPRQVPASPELRPDTIRSSRPADPANTDRPDGGPLAGATQQPTAAPPPAWPPVAPHVAKPEGDAGDAAGDPDGAPAVPEQLAAALDITSEMPRVPTDAPDQGWNGATGTTRPADAPAVPAAYTPPPLAAPAGQPAPAGAEPARAVAFADETMEMPIFRELESAWFRSRGTEPVTLPPPQPATPTAPAARAAVAETDEQPAEAPVEAPASAASTGTTGTNMGSSPQSAVPEPAWRSAADDGWTAATAAAEPAVAGVTDAGLPKRVPMAQLVPGGVEKTAASANNKRSPEQVRGLLSAYHRGVQRGRTGKSGDDKTPESSTAPGNSSHGGKEQEA